MKAHLLLVLPHDPHVTQECAGCGRLRMPAVRRPDSQVLCSSCWTPPRTHCTACGGVGPPVSIGPTERSALAVTGASPGRAYLWQMRQARPITRRPLPTARLGSNCAHFRRRSAYARCGQVRPAPPAARTARLPRLPASLRQSLLACGRTGPLRSLATRSVCGACYRRVLDHPGSATVR